MQTSFLNSEELNSQAYKALARKYRPKNFQNMVGQDVLVQTLTNAINSKRIPHAILLTGIRGVGKTTTARIISRSLNCLGEDGLRHETPNPCGVCESCDAINKDSHQDIIEIDAASHTGVADIREIIENVRYKPISARYKIYIIDEVHMLSNNAFNALLKTLEEPPSHVKFIFATTEVRKIPITILSRCQRFDLKRIETTELVKYYDNILTKEGFKADHSALYLIANAAQGSVRDGLSMLDQAIALSGGKLDEESVRSMLGLADITLTFTLFDNLVTGKTLELITHLKKLYNSGADPHLILQDLLEITHGITKTKVSENKNISAYPEYEWQKYSYYAALLSIPFLARMWQALLKGLDEMKNSYFIFSNLEMILIRIAHMSNMPTLDTFISQPEEELKSQSNNNQKVKVNNELSYSSSITKKISTFEELTELCLEHKEMVMYHHLISDTRVIAFNPPNITIKLLENAPQRFNQTLQSFLNQSTNQQWKISISNEETSKPTFLESEQEKERQHQEKIKNSELVQDILNTFTGTEILDIKTKQTFKVT